MSDAARTRTQNFACARHGIRGILVVQDLRAAEAVHAYRLHGRVSQGQCFRDRFRAAGTFCCKTVRSSVTALAEAPARRVGRGSPVAKLGADVVKLNVSKFDAE
ncbi:MAG: hypothetical protein M0Z66_12895 [Thermaerobacter sp.]|nr:hypothetical protein [Thermaerobacter sp.]